MKEYKTRLADSILQKKLASSGAVLIEGAKWCGKTTTASQIAKSILLMQDPAQKKQNIEMADMDPSFLLNGETPRLIDEWQLAPKLWDAIRFEVDKRDEFGQFVLTGSAVPADLSEISHSGTGRISRMLMRPMSLYESGESNGSVSLADLFSDNEKVTGTNSLDLEQIAFLICRGGLNPLEQILMLLYNWQLTTLMLWSMMIFHELITLKGMLKKLNVYCVHMHALLLRKQKYHQ